MYEMHFISVEYCSRSCMKYKFFHYGKKHRQKIVFFDLNHQGARELVGTIVASRHRLWILWYSNNRIFTNQLIIVLFSILPPGPSLSGLCQCYHFIYFEYIILYFVHGMLKLIRTALKMRNLNALWAV